MNISYELWLAIAAVLLCTDIFIINIIIIKSIKSKRHKKIYEYQNINFLKLLSENHLNAKNKIPISSYFKMKQSVQLDKLRIENIKKHVNLEKAESKYIRSIKSIHKNKRLEASVYLGLLGTEKARAALEKSIIRERDNTCKLYMANALTDIGNKMSIPVLVASLIGSKHWYREKVNMLIVDFGEAFNSYLPEIINSDKIEIKELIVEFSSVYFSEALKKYLIELIDSKDEEIRRLKGLYEGSKDDFYVLNFSRLVYKAADILAGFYPKVMDDSKYLNSEDIKLKNTAVRAMSNFSTLGTIYKLISYLKDEEVARSAVHAISKIIERNPEYINVIVIIFNKEQEIKVKQRLSEILVCRIEYFIMKLSAKNTGSAASIIKEILTLGRTSEIINFLNMNKDLDIENELIAIIKEVLYVSPLLEKELCSYLDKRLLEKCGLKPYKAISSCKEEEKDKKLINTLCFTMIFTIMIFPIIYVLRHYNILFNIPVIQQVKIYVVDFNYYLIFYFIAINLVYFGLLALSFAQVRQQYRRWNMKSISLLFKKKMLPSISIIAPAYNEEKTIIESANSLLNLKYPNYELIIVNDGSGDDTLNVLIRYFNLIKVDYIFDYKLNTKTVRGVYMNRSMPKLIVVDKENGGKADSLNAGINISTKEYFCGIDADSLLEDEALLKLASLILDEGMETPALGGNIFPINGCKIERGQIKEIKVPKNTLARFQTMEYIRAFMAGRLGWASINSLLIISGAFGLFRKDRVISVGGYLTSSGRYAKDTVGEDMELVVRIRRLMRELGLKYKICYAFNANCWTEVPEDIKSLKKQRYRWHRGLIDILTFHKKMLFNPRYGRTGMLAMPYFFIFEMLGPMIELQGYIMVVAAFILDLLNPKLALLIFIFTILMGMLISTLSLLIAEKDIKYFKFKDIILLILYSIIENLGPRQLFSLWRVSGCFNMLWKPSEWGKLDRKGFSVSDKTVDM